MTRVDGSVIDVTSTPLPDGGTLATFADVTDSVNFENALVEKNEALEEAVAPQERLRPPRLLRAALAAAPTSSASSSCSPTAPPGRSTTSSANMPATS